MQAAIPTSFKKVKHALDEYVAENGEHGSDEYNQLKTAFDNALETLQNDTGAYYFYMKQKMIDYLEECGDVNNPKEGFDMTTLNQHYYDYLSALNKYRGSSGYVGELSFEDLNNLSNADFTIFSTGELKLEIKSFPITLKNYTLTPVGISGSYSNNTLSNLTNVAGACFRLYLRVPVQTALSLSDGAYMTTYNALKLEFNPSSDEEDRPIPTAVANAQFTVKKSRAPCLLLTR